MSDGGILDLLETDAVFRDGDCGPFFREIRRRIGPQGRMWRICPEAVSPAPGELADFIFLDRMEDATAMERWLPALRGGGILGGDGFLKRAEIRAAVNARFRTVQQDGDRWLVFLAEEEDTVEPLLLGEALESLLKGEKRVRYIANPGNTGDAVIARGTAETFARLGLEITPEAETVLIAGGGNLIPRYDDLHKALSALPRDGLRILLMPCTTSDCFGLLAEFSDLTLLARERTTERLAREAGIPTLLCHDAAFEVDFSRWENLPETDGLPLLRNFRQDCESAGHPQAQAADNRDLSEEYGNCLWDFPSAMEASGKFITEINHYRVVHTDRLHVAIVAACLGKQTRLYPNDYHKNLSMYQNSLAGFPNVSFIDPARWPRAAGFDSFEEYIFRHPQCWLEIDPAAPAVDLSCRCFGEAVDFAPLNGPAIPPGGILWLDEALIRGGDGLTETASGERLMDLSWSSEVRCGHLHYAEGPVSERIAGWTVSLVTPWARANYAHFTLDVLGRIPFLRAAGVDFHEVDTFLLPPPPTALDRELLGRSGLPAEKIRWVSGDPIFQIEHLIAPSPPGAARLHSRRGAGYVKTLGRPPDGRSGKRIFVDRPGQSRDFQNREEITTLLRAYGFEFFDESSYSQADIIFANAEVVAGLHGAGLTNLVFCQAGTKALEIVPSAWPSPFYRSLALACDLDYGCVLGRSEGHEGRPRICFFNSPMWVDPGDFEEALRWATRPTEVTFSPGL